MSGGHQQKRVADNAPPVEVSADTQKAIDELVSHYPLAEAALLPASCSTALISRILIRLTTGWYLSAS